MPSGTYAAVGPRIFFTLWFALAACLVGLLAWQLAGGAPEETAHTLVALGVASVLAALGPLLFYSLGRRRSAGAQARLEAAFDRIETGIITLNDEGEISYANPALLEILGMRREDVAGNRPEELLPAESADIYLEQRTLRASGIYQPYRVKTCRGDGGEAWLEVVPSPLLSGEGEPISTLAIVRDVTDETRAALERAALENQLRHVKRLEALGTLAGGIAHDFNNIFFAILGHAEMAEDRISDPATRLDLAQIARAGERGRELVQQMLTFARAKDRERSAMRVAPLVKECAKLLLASLPAGIELETEVDPETPLIETHPAAMHQVLMNLATNALQAVKGAGRVRISLGHRPPTDAERRAHPELSEECYAVLRVSDDGCGIPAESQHRVFEPFYTTREVGQGSGMGLAVVHGIVEEHSGTIDLRSETGRGTDVTVFFPLAASEEPEPGASADAGPSTRARILVVDDDATICQLITSMLEADGHQVESFDKPAEALGAFLDDPARYDVIVTDHAMPGLTGDALVEKVRGAGHDVPVLMVTGSDPRPSSARLEALGIAAAISKPMSLRELREGLWQALRASMEAPAPVGGVR